MRWKKRGGKNRWPQRGWKCTLKQKVPTWETLTLHNHNTTNTMTTVLAHCVVTAHCNVSCSGNMRYQTYSKLPLFPIYDLVLIIATDCNCGRFISSFGWWNSSRGPNHLNTGLDSCALTGSKRPAWSDAVIQAGRTMGRGACWEHTHTSVHSGITKAS